MRDNYTHSHRRQPLEKHILKLGGASQEVGPTPMDIIQIHAKPGEAGPPRF